MSVFDDVREVAQRRIRDQLMTEASTTNNLLRTLGMEIAKECGCVTNFGPIKTEERANEKVYGPTAQGGYGGDWYDIKDLVRMTIIAPFVGHVSRVQATIRAPVRRRNRMGILKDTEVRAETDPCGYSGVNFVIRLLNGRPGEIQVNVPEMIYAKEKEAVSRKVLGDAVFFQIQARFQIECGLGHTLYEIYRAAPAGAIGRLAAQASRWYYKHLRGQLPTQNQKQLRGDLLSIKSKEPSKFRPH